MLQKFVCIWITVPRVCHKIIRKTSPERIGPTLSLLLDIIPLLDVYTDIIQILHTGVSCACHIHWRTIAKYLRMSNEFIHLFFIFIFQIQDHYSQCLLRCIITIWRKKYDWIQWNSIHFIIHYLKQIDSK